MKLIGKLLPVLFLLLRSDQTNAFSLPKSCTGINKLNTCLKSSSSSSTCTTISSTKNNNEGNPNTSSSTIKNEGIIKTDCVVVGAGPAGLLSAIMLSQKYPQKTIQVYDRLNLPPSPTDENIWNDVAKFYLIGLGQRGQKALAKYGVWDDVEKVCTAVVGRKDWSPESDAEDGVERIFTDRPVMTQVLPRDKLVGVLHEHVVQNYSEKIVLNYGYEIIPEDFDADNKSAVKIRVSKCDVSDDIGTNRQAPSSTVNSSGDDVERSDLCDIDNSFVVTTELLIAADGTARTVANEMEKSDKKRWEALNPVQRLWAEKPFKVKRYVDDNRRVYKTIPMKLPKDWRPDLNYSARTKDGRINYDALPADKNGNYCGVLLIRESDEFAAANTDPKKLRLLLDENLPQFSCLLDDKTVEDIARKPPSFLPSFRYAGPRLNQGDRTLILGDCAHTVKPYFGLGANSALEDVKILEDAIDATKDIPAAVKLFSKKRAAESESLVKLSRELDRPGKLGLLTFLIPIILDGIFHKMLPKIFAPNTIAMLQKEGITFAGVRRRKRMDRLGQLTLIGAFISSLTWGLKCVLQGVAKAISASPKVGAGISGVALLGVVVKIINKFNPNLAPADVMPKKSKK